MIELLKFSIQPYNVVFTMLLGLAVFYWLSVIIGVLDLDVLDFDIDVAEADLDVETELETELETGGGLVHGLLSFLYVGQVPVTVIASAFVLLMWIAVIMSNYWLQTDSWKMAALVLLANMLLCFITTRLLLWPLRAVFGRMMSEEHQLKNVIGLTGTVLSAADDQRLGQAEAKSRDSFVRINIRTRPGIKVAKGELVRIIAVDGPHSYIVEPID